MGKSLTEAAKAILMKEDSAVGGYPSVSPMQAGHPDRDAGSSNPNAASLHPGSKYSDSAPIVNPGSTPPNAHDYEDTGPAPVSATDVPGSVKAGQSTKKDTSKSSVAASAPEGSKSLSEESDDDVEISEELEDFISEMVAKGLSEEEIAQAIEENFEIVEEEEQIDERKGCYEEDGEEKEKEKEEKHKKHMKEHVDALLAGENLSEEFRSKAETIFESAVNTRVNEELETLEEAYAQSLEEEVEKIRNELTEQVDDYLNYVVEQWVTENEVAIETGLRSEITEDFISGLRNLFAEHYIDVPEEKVSVIDELGTKVAELEAKLNEEIENNVNLKKALNESKQFEVLVTACDGLTTTQAEKLKALSENVTFTSPEEYAQKIYTLRESYFQAPVINADNVLDQADDNRSFITEEVTGRMGAYVKALGKSIPK